LLNFLAWSSTGFLQGESASRKMCKYNFPYDESTHSIHGTKCTRLDKAGVARSKIFINELGDMFWLHGFLRHNGEQVSRLFVIHWEAVYFMRYSTSNACPFYPNQ